MLFILEGPDGAGKSTLAAELQQSLKGSTLVHHGPYRGAEGRELASIYMASLKPALEGNDLILDRCWLSEPIYGDVYRGMSSRLSSAHVRMLERAALSVGAVVVNCRPSYDQCLSAFNSGREEMLEDDRQLRAVYDQYEELTTQLPVVNYNFEVSDLEELATAVKFLNGAWKPKVVLLGDRPNVRTHAQSALQVPFVSFTGLGCSEWLAEQLNDAKIPERLLSWRNAYSSDGKPTDPATLPEGVPVIALGRNARQWCADHGISHRSVPHPQAHRRFHSGTPYPLIKELKNVLGL